VGFVTELESGAAGVKCRISVCGTELTSTERAVCIQDVRHAVLWTCSRSPWRMDLGPETLQLLRFDVQRHARGIFEALFEAKDTNPKPRTADPDWSPLIEAQTQTFGGRVLRLVHRTHHEPLNEVVEGRLVVPTGDGAISISAVASAEEVGGREKQVATKQRQAGQGSVPPGGRSLQAVADDPRWDDEFPEHPLSRVRAALDWLTDPSGGGLWVTSPSAETYSSQVVLDEASSVIQAPP